MSEPMNNLDLLASAATASAPAPSIPAPLADPPSSAAQPLDDPPPQRPHKRIINENTDYSTLTDQEIQDLTLAMTQESAPVERPLVSPPVPIAVLKSEYSSSGEGEEKSLVVKKIEYLEKNGWEMVWRAKGDGDCFYRCKLEQMSPLPLFFSSFHPYRTLSSSFLHPSRFLTAFTLAYLLRILHSFDPPSQAQIAFSNVQSARAILQQVGFDMDLVSLFVFTRADLLNLF